MDIQDCNELNIFLNLSTNQLECLPGVLVAPPGYSQLLPATDVKPKFKYKWLLILLGVYVLAKK